MAELRLKQVSGFHAKVVSIADNDVVQYFDHPRFGAIAYVRELEDEASAGETAESAG